MKPTSRWNTVPFVRILPAAIVGIVLANNFALSWWFVVGSAVTTYAFAWFGRGTKLSGVYVFASLLFTFVILGKASVPRSDLPRGERLLMVVRVMSEPVEKGRWRSTAARVVNYREDNSPERNWRTVDENIMLSVDTSHRITAGDEFACRAYVNSFPEGSYGRLMIRRGFTARAYAGKGGIVRFSPVKYNSPLIAAGKMQNAADERLRRMGLDESAYQVASAMTIGARRSMSTELRSHYSRSGAAHLLAVSGLHVGIVFGLVNLLLWLLPAINHGHIVKSIVAIVIIWVYAFMTGLSPSVMRAAMMFSGVQIALAATAFRQPLNILLATAAVMLTLNPNNLYDISFQLSFLAVLFIMLWFMPLYRLLRTRYKILNALISVVLLGVVATVGTAPVTVYTFGYFSPVGVLINPVVVLTAHVIVLGSLVWIIAPLEFMAPVFRFVVGAMAEVQNGIVSWSASLSWATVQVEPPLWSVFALYAVYLIITVALSGQKTEKNVNFAG